MDHLIKLMQQRNPEILGESVGQKAAALAIACLVQQYQESGSQVSEEQVDNDIKEAMTALHKWMWQMVKEKNFIESHPTVPDSPTILVNVSGGVVQDVYGKDGLVNVIVVDWDCEGVSDNSFEVDAFLFKAPDGKIGHSSLRGIFYWEQLENQPELVTAVKNALDQLEPVDASYVSVWDNGTTVETPCKYDPRSRRCYDIVQSDTDVGDAQLVEEYVLLSPDSKVTKNVTFVY